MRTLTLNNGTAYEAPWCGVAQGILTAAIAGGHGVAELAVAFSDPGATSRMVYCYGEMEDVYEGYTRLLSVQAGLWGENTVTVSLAQGPAQEPQEEPLEEPLEEPPEEPAD